MLTRLASSMIARPDSSSDIAARAPSLSVQRRTQLKSLLRAVLMNDRIQATIYAAAVFVSCCLHGVSDHEGGEVVYISVGIVIRASSFHIQLCQRICRWRDERSMRSEHEDSVRLLDLSHEVDYIKSNLLIEYDLSSRVGEQSQNEAMHNSVSKDQRSYLGSWVHCPTMNCTHVSVYPVYPTASLTERSILTTTSTTHHIILSVRTNQMCTCSVCTYVLIIYVCAT